jgi:Photosynthetic reaction centre cytochrome C subunit
VKQAFYFFRRPVLLAILVLGAALSLGVLGAAQESKPAPSAKTQTARQRFKNIKVLKNMPADQLLPAMQGINASLGVRCDFCHVVNPDHTGFERDDKPTKRIARQMMVMTGDLNAHQKILEHKATCYMCHHGHPEPETQAPPMARPGGPPPGGTPPAPR